MTESMIQSFQMDIDKLIYSINQDYNLWLKELNNNGREFDYDSQDIYQESYNLISKQKLYYEYEDEDFVNKKDEILSKLKEPLEKIVKLYDEHYDFFDSLNREEILANTFREYLIRINWVKFNPMDATINVLVHTFEIFKAKYVSIQYYETELYMDEGFVERNFHQLIAERSEILLNQISTKNYREKSTEFESVSINYLVTYFWSKDYIQSLFENIEEFDLYKFLNLKLSTHKIKVRSDKNNYVYLLIYLTSKTINEKEYERLWIEKMLKTLNLNKKSYGSHSKTYLNNYDSLDKHGDPKKFTKKIIIDFKKIFDELDIQYQFPRKI